MTRDEQYGFLCSMTDATNIIYSHAKPGEVDDKTFKLLSRIVKEIHENYDAKTK